MIAAAAVLGVGDRAAASTIYDLEISATVRVGSVDLQALGGPVTAANVFDLTLADQDEQTFTPFPIGPEPTIVGDFITADQSSTYGYVTAGVSWYLDHLAVNAYLTGEVPEDRSLVGIIDLTISGTIDDDDPLVPAGTSLGSWLAAQVFLDVDSNGSYSAYSVLNGDVLDSTTFSTSVRIALWSDADVEPFRSEIVHVSTTTAVPEPTSLALAGLGLAGALVGPRARRRR